VDANFKLAARNIPNMDVLPNAGLNVYDVLRRGQAGADQGAVEAISPLQALAEQGSRVMAAAATATTTPSCRR
jgi:ribosomal protein L4